MANIICTKCGFTTEGTMPEGQELQCLQCGSSMQYEDTSLQDSSQDGPPSSTDPGNDQEIRPESEFHRLNFTGTTGEYFRIWIVNVFLTIITLGIYGAWAKVRTRQYFYANTKLAEQPFSYLGDPLAILKGNLLIGGGIIIYSIVKEFVPMLAGIVGILLYLTFPFLIYKSLRFNARNSSFRNIRFHFLGTLKEGYITYILYPILIPFTLGAIIPYWEFRRKKYFFNNFAFGNTGAGFNGRPGPFYMAYLMVFLVFTGLAIFTTLLIAGGSALFFLKYMALSAQPQIPKKFFIFLFLAVYPLLLVVFFSVQQYLYGKFMNYCWSETKMGQLRFSCTLNVWRLIWIRISNLFAIIFSIGLLMPWAKIRRTRYTLENITVITEGSLDTFTASIGPDEQSAIGDSATDFFDIDIGL